MKKLFKSKRFWVVAIIVVLVVGYFVYRSLTGSVTTATQYVTAKAANGTLVVSVAGSGQVAALNQTNIQPQISGQVLHIPVVNNQSVKAGDLLVELDPTNDQRSVRNAQTSLENAQLSLASLLAPPATSTLLQSQQSVVQAQQSLVSDQNTLATDYANAYTDISNAFIDLPGVMTSLNNVLYSVIINKAQGQADADAYTNLVSTYNPTVVTYNQSAIAGYQTALTAYNQSLADFKATTINSSTSTVETMLAETYATLKTVSVANGNVKNLLDVVANSLQQIQQKAPAQLSIDENTLQTIITTTNSHLATILQTLNTLQNDKQNIITAGLSTQQTAASLAQLQAGATQLQIQTQQISVTQAENALSDAQQNLANDYVRAPFSGIVTSITAKVDEPVGTGSTLAVLLTDQQTAEATLNEVDAVNVMVGDPATITFAALPNVSLTGKVSQVDTLGTVSQGVVTYNVQVTLDVTNPQVKPGMSDNVSIVTKVEPDVLLVPNAAVTTRQGVSTVQVMGANGVPTTATVTVGDSNSTMTVITAGLNEGDAVVTRTTTAAKTTTAATTGGLGGIRIPGLTGGGGARGG